MTQPLNSLDFRSLDEMRALLFEISLVGILIWDARGRILDCNTAYHRRLGYAKAELIGRNLAELNEAGLNDAGLDKASPAQTLAKQLAEAKTQGMTTIEGCQRHKDGSCLHLAISCHHILLADQDAFFGIAHDHSEYEHLKQHLEAGVSFYRAALNSLPQGFLVVAISGRVLEANDAYSRLSGYSHAELLGMEIADLEANETSLEINNRIRDVLAQGYSHFRSQHRHRDGSLWPVEISIQPSTLQGGMLFVHAEKISDKIIKESHLELTALILEIMEQAVLITDANNEIINMNPAASRITGYQLEEVIGQNPSIFSSGRHDKAFYAKLWHSIKTKGRWAGEIWDRRKNGEIYAKWQVISIIHDAQGRIKNYVSVFSDITEHKKTAELLWRQSNFDLLTELPNRHLLLERLKQALKKAKQTGLPLALLFVDLDRFKEVNDSLGHAQGDRLLIEAARRLKGLLQDTDTIARTAGDEFTLLLPEFGNRSHLDIKAQAILDALAIPYILDGGEAAHISASCGITIYPDDGEDCQTLLRHADQALSTAKDEGRNRFGYFTPAIHREAMEKQSLLRDLRHAMALGQFEVYLQPIVELDSGRITKAEALLRWQHPERGFISPMVFIPLAEDAGLIHEIGDWVFDESIQTIARWRQDLGCTIQISVNKSPRQFEKTPTPSWSDRLRALELDGSSVTVEITEGSLLSSSHSIRDQLIHYRNSGIEVSIDDFGTGFSALSYLHRFDIDYLKIDRSFVIELESDTPNTALVEAIIVMAHKLGIKTIAEGVETLGQRDILKAFGCDYIQGYFYSKPLPIPAFETLMLQNHREHP